MKFKMNLRSFMFSMGVLLFALIAVNLMSSGIKMEGFEEGAAAGQTLRDKCSQNLPNNTNISDLEKAIDDQTKNVWRDANNIDYNKLSTYKNSQGNCDAYIKEYANSAKPAAKPVAAKPVAAKPVAAKPVAAKPAAKPVAAKPAAKPAAAKKK